MTRFPLRTLAAALLLATACAAAGQASPGPDAQSVLDKVTENLRGVSQWATLSLTVERPDRTTEYVMEIVTDGDKRSLARVTAPPREAGQAFLSVGSNLLIYNPRLGRSLRLPPSGRSNAFLGSDLSYDDLAGEEYRDQYDAAIASEDAQAITLDLTPHPEAPTPYGKLAFAVQPTTYAPLSLTFFDQRGNAVKRMSFSDFKKVDGKTVPERFEVVDLLKQGYRTVAAFTKVDYQTPVPERCFTEAALERGCR
jgi:outer membrane lipoprotein-sorting protein